MERARYLRAARSADGPLAAGRRRSITPSALRLAAGAAGTLLTANAARPVMHSQLVWPSFAGQLIPAERPRAVIAAQAALLGLLAGKGGWTRTDLLTAALTAGSWAGLARIDHQARKAPEILERALTEALGTGYRSRIVHGRQPEADGREPGDPSLLSALRARSRYCQFPDGPAGRPNLLDVWRRLDAEAGAPVLLQVAGGAWVTGGKRGQAYPLLSHLVERGWVCVAINYRLAPRQKWPAAVVDVKRALTWIKQNIAGYGGDPGFVAITGGSAGGHLTALAALTAGDAEFQPGFEDADTSVQAAVPLYGVYDWTGGPGTEPLLQSFLERWVVPGRFADIPDVFTKASPVHRVSPSAPPTFVVHGQRDNLVPVTQARPFVERLRAESPAPVGYAELPGAPHGFDILTSVRALATVHAVSRFLGVVHGDYVRAAEPAAGPGAGSVVTAL
jgi:acetyl esterase/lipase